MADLVRLTPSNHKGSTISIGNGVSIPIGQIGHLSYQADLAGFTSDELSVMIWAC